MEGVSYIEGGKYRQKGFKTEKEADKWAKKREKESVEFGSATNLSTAERSAVVDNRKKLDEVGLSLADAINFAISYHERSANSTSVKNLFAEVIQTRAHAGLSKSHLDGLTRKLGKFEKAFGEQSVAHIEKTQIEKWLHGLAKDFQPRTVNHHRTALVVAFNEAIELGYIDKNPALRVKAMKVVEAKSRCNGRSVTYQTCWRSRSSDSPDLRDWHPGGIRDSEIKKLKWSDIDLETGVIHVRAVNAKSFKNQARGNPLTIYAEIGLSLC